MTDRVEHQIRVRLPRRVAVALRERGAITGIRTGALSRMLVRRWLRQNERNTEATESTSLLRTQTARAATVKLLVTHTEFQRLKVRAEAAGLSVGDIVGQILSACSANSSSNSEDKVALGSARR